MAKTIKYRKGVLGEIFKGIAKPIRNAKPYFEILQTLISTKTDRVFNKEGRVPGHPKWKKINTAKYQYKSGLYAIRYGSDGTPKPIYKKGDGKWRKKRSGVRRWGDTSKALQASRQFQESFKKLELTGKKLLFGSRYKIADLIMSNPWRPVVYVSKTDLNDYQQKWYAFLNKGINFENIN